MGLNFTPLLIYQLHCVNVIMNIPVFYYSPLDSIICSSFLQINQRIIKIDENEKLYPEQCYNHHFITISWKSVFIFCTESLLIKFITIFSISIIIIRFRSPFFTTNRRSTCLTIRQGPQKYSEIKYEIFEHYLEILKLK